MSKKSNKTSHVLNLLTNRIGATEQDFMQEPPQVHSQEPEYMQETKVPIEESEQIQEPSNAPIQEPEQMQEPSIAPIEEPEQMQEPSIAPIEEPEQMQEPSNAPIEESEQIQEPSIAPIEEPEQIQELPKVESVPMQEPPQTQISTETYESTQVHPSDESTTFSIPSEDPISELIRQELEHYFETEIIPFQPEDFSQKGITPMSHTSEIENENMLNPTTINSSFDRDEYVFINIIEEFVKNECVSLMKKMEVCSCNKCKNDVIALALNHLPPKYVVTRKGYLLSKLLAYEKQYKADVLTAITNACIQVKSMPHHNK